MIFIGCSYRIGFPRYGNHHSRWTDSRAFPIWMRRLWNNLKQRYPGIQIAEWTLGYRKPYCKKCTEMFIEDENFLYYDGIKNPTREDRIKIVERLNKRFNKKD